MGKVKIGIPYKGRIVGVEIPEKVMVLGMNISVKILAALGLTVLVIAAGAIFYGIKGRESGQESTAESKSLQG